MLAVTPASALELTAEERAFLADNPVIVVGGEMDWPPMDFVEDGVYQGAAADYLDAISELSGINFEVVTGYTWSELITMLRAKEIDMVPMMYWTEGRGHEFNLTNPYITVRHYVFTLGKRPDIRDFGDLYGLTMAIPADYAYIEYFNENHPEVKILEVPDAVLIGDADAIIENTASIAYYTAKQSIIGLAPAFPVRFEVNNVHMAVRSDKPILRDILQKALDEISTESTTKIMEKWTGSEAAAKTFLTAKAEFTEQERSYLQQAGLITACLNGDRMPLESVRNGNHEGMTSDYARILADTLKVPIAARVTRNWRQARADLVAGKCDVITLAVDNEEDSASILYSSPYIVENLALATTVEERFFETVAELPDSRLGVVDGYTNLEALRERFPNQTFVAYATLDDALNAVAGGQLFGVLDYVPTLSIALRRGYERTLKISGDFRDEVPGFSLAVNADKPLLASAIEKTVAAMPDAQRLNIHQKWVAVSIEKELDYKLFLQTAVIALVLLLLLYLRYAEVRKHRREIQLKNEQLRTANSLLADQADSAMHMAHHDQLTGLPNRAKMLEDLDHSIKICRRTGNKLALLFLDLDRFKYVNDSLGHDVGDKLLQAVAERMQTLLRETDTLYRLGGDEFVVLLEAISDSYSPCVVAQRVVTALEQPFQLGDNTVNIGTSIGISLYPDVSDELNTLVKYADSAMYSAKDSGRSGYKYYHEELSQQAARRVVMETALRRSLKDQDFSLAIQPIVDLKSGTVVKGEALMRWRHPELGNVPPDQFIPIAEEFGLIVELGEWVLRKACEALLELDAQGCKLDALCVNTSTVEFVRGDVTSRFKSIIDEYGVDARRIEIEITERYMLENDEVAETELRELCRMGHSISVDDFGTGYSSLSYMKRLPLDIIKIDRSFIQNVPFDQNDVEISQAIISLSHSLGYEVVAEGVETEQQLDFLLERSCNFAQGYLFSAPVPVEEFARCAEKINEQRKVDTGWTAKLRILRP